ncbi:Thymosin beta-4 [Sciurus carolinensis]|uniref:Thymosin beta-4 n=1 Tax=Sciurus carolinensis TaxID=30640 RepID=A0AA41MZT5_SCICA|nr:thymosin beta-4-like [Sciurus carolinensis]MBZ3880842.1 Thymosin beta-4 [Sciurus carolinensis]
MSDKADVAEIERFNKQHLKRVEIQKKNPLPSKETIELEKQTDESQQGMHAKMHCTFLNHRLLILLLLVI